MCELFGLCAGENIRINEMLDAFFHHSDVHKDGWGIATMYDSGVSIEKEPEKALKSTYLRHRMSGDIRCANMLAHIRMATIGRQEYANCHPFVYDDLTGRSWTLIHNGTMFKGDLLAPFIDSQEGTTDSERVLMYIVDQVNRECTEERRGLSADERFKLIDSIIVRLSEGNKLNFILYDGDYMYIHTNSPASLHQWHEAGVYLFSTKPLLTDGWKPVAKNQLHVFRAGQECFNGTIHPHDFNDEDYDMTPLLSAFAEL